MQKFLLGFLCIIPLAGWCQEGNFQEEFAGLVYFNSQRVTALVEVIPEDKFDWRPSEGVRSIGEASMHLASANYFFGSMLGPELPEGVDMQNLEKNAAGKENIIRTLKESYAFLIEAGKSVKSEDLDNEVSFPGGDKFSLRTTMMIAQSHCSEHMGQLIAYARSNGIAPPWSEGEN